MARRPQETTRLIREATSVIVNKSKNKELRKCGIANSRFLFFNKNSSILVLKVRKLDDEVIDIGREFQILGPW